MKRKSIGFLLMMIWILPACTKSIPTGESVKWQTYAEGTRTAEKEGKKIFLSFYADWCTFCAKMDKETLKNPDIVKFLNENFISVRVNTEKEEEVARKHFVRGLPMTWFLEPNGDKISSLPGYIPPEMFMQILQFINTGSYKQMTFKEYVNGLEKVM
jgi:thioredoxin-related protein